VHDRGQLDPRRQQFDETLDDQFTGRGDRRDFQFRAGTLTDELPRHDVGVVLHRRDQDLVAGLEKRQRKAVGDGVDRLRGAAGEDDFVAR
jgi:hypothetical protein